MRNQTDTDSSCQSWLLLLFSIPQTFRLSSRLNLGQKKQECVDLRACARARARVCAASKGFVSNPWIVDSLRLDWWRDVSAPLPLPEGRISRERQRQRSGNLPVINGGSQARLKLPVPSDTPRPPETPEKVPTVAARWVAMWLRSKPTRPGQVNAAGKLWRRMGELVSGGFTLARCSLSVNNCWGFIFTAGVFRVCMCTCIGSTGGDYGWFLTTLQSVRN